MSDFGDILGAGQAFIGDLARIPAATTFGSQSSEALLHTQHSKPRQQDDPFDGIYGAWLESAHFTAQRARLAALSMPKSATALARLAQAEMAAGEDAHAQETASRVLELALADKKSKPETSTDVPAVFAAARVLVMLGHSDLVERQLRELSEEPTLALTAASLAADSNRLEDALGLLDNLTSPDAETLRGFIYFRLNNAQRAITHLRRAYNTADPDPDICINLARAFWKLGSLRKATRFARQAARLAPGRKDISLLLLEFLISSGQIKSAEHEISKLLSDGVVEPPELVLMRANIAIVQRNFDRALSLLRRAESLAKPDNNVLTGEIQGNIARLRYEMGEIREDQALRAIRTAMNSAPYSALLLMIFASVNERKSLAPGLRRHYDRVRQQVSVVDLLPVQAQLAYLEGDFNQAAALAMQWSNEQPFNPFAASSALLLFAYSSHDWRAAAQIARSAIHRFGDSNASISNNAAYVLALAGETSLAERVMERARQAQLGPDFVIQATWGLIAIVQGNMQEGMRRYRRAIEMAERSPRGHIYRPLMVINQGLALWLLGLTRFDIDLATRAASLPVVELPSNWEDLAEFLLLRWECEQVGCPWPPMVQ